MLGFWIVSAVFIALYLYRTWHLIPLKIVNGVNSDNFTIKTFVALVGEASGLMRVCDDGNKMEGSIYESDQVVEAVKRQLVADPTFCMHCLFFSNDDTLFRRSFKNENRIIFRIAPTRRSMHYKIINDGRKGYVSTHGEGEVERSYTIYSGVYGPSRARIFGPYMEDIDQVFANAA